MTKMDRFYLIQDAAVITFRKGVYKQQPVFRRGGHVYAAHGGGFVALHRGGTTGVPDLLWRDIDLAQRRIGYDDVGRMVIDD